MKYLFLILPLLLTSCNWIENGSRKIAHKTGELIGKAGSEFGIGVTEGIKVVLKKDIQISPALTELGVEIGQTFVSSSDGAKDNVLLTYFIFSKDFNQTIAVKLLDKGGLEYGRTTLVVKGELGQADYSSFTFSDNVQIKEIGSIVYSLKE